MTASRGVFLTLGAAALALGAVVVDALRSPPRPPSAPGDFAVQLPQLPPPPVAALPPVTELSETVRRPLFDPDRRPPPAPAAPAQASAPPAPPPPLKVNLIGVIMGPSERLALVASPSERQARALREGDAIDGWRVEAITARSVLFTHRDSRREIALDPKKQPPPSTAADNRRGRKSRLYRR